MTALRYSRAPSEEFIEDLRGGLLSPLLEPWEVSNLPLDFQLRENDKAMLYCGRTRIVVAEFRDTHIVVTAANSYKRQACARGLLKKWRPDERGFRDALARYVRSVKVDKRWTCKEGTVQANWMAMEEPWTSIDRESVIGGGLRPIRRVDEATEAIVEIGAGWAQVDKPKEANELDALAIDADGRLTLVEHKWGGASDLYYAPLQALRYAWEWSLALEDILLDVGDLIDAKQRLGLLPADLPTLNGDLRVAVAWGDHSPSKEVLRRAHLVRDELLTYLPPGVDTIELWSTDGGRPCAI